MSPYETRWHGTSPPTPSSRSSWTGCATSCATEVWPIETVFDELGEDGFERAIAPLQERVKERGLWAAHLPPELGGQGFGQVKLGLMHEILGTSPFAPVGVRQRRARLGQLARSSRSPGTPDQKER